MADILSLIPGVKRLPFFGGTETDTSDTPFLQAPNPTTLLGVPLSGLATAGIGYGLGSLLTNKRNRPIGQLRGLQLGLGLGMGAVNQEQARYDKMMESMLDKGLLQPYEAPATNLPSQWQQATPEQAMFGAAPMASTPTPIAPPAINYGGTRLMLTPTTDLGNLFPGVPGLAGVRGRVTPETAYSAGQLGIYRSREEREAAEETRKNQERERFRAAAKTAGIDPDLPLPMIADQLARKQGLADLPSYRAAIQQFTGPDTKVQWTLDANGRPQAQIVELSDFEKQQQQDQLQATRDAQTIRQQQMESGLLSQQYQKEEAEARLAAIKEQAAGAGRTDLINLLEKSKDNLDALDKQILSYQDPLGNAKPGFEAVLQQARINRAKAQEVHQARLDTAYTTLQARQPGQTPGQAATEATPTAPQEAPISPEIDAQAKEITQDLKALLEAGPESYLRPSRPGPVQDAYDKATTKYYEATDEPLADIRDQLRGRFTLGGTIRPKVPPEVLSTLTQRYGATRANAAVRRWYNRR